MFRTTDLLPLLENFRRSNDAYQDKLRKHALDHLNKSKVQLQILVDHVRSAPSPDPIVLAKLLNALNNLNENIESSDRMSANSLASFVGSLDYSIKCIVAHIMANKSPHEPVPKSSFLSTCNIV